MCQSVFVWSVFLIPDLLLFYKILIYQILCHFDNKHALFKESVLGEFHRMMNYVVGEVDASLSVKDIYVKAVIKRKHFSDYQIQVYSLAIQGTKTNV